MADSLAFCARFLRDLKNNNVATTSAKTPIAMPMERPTPLPPPPESLPSLAPLVAVSPDPVADTGAVGGAVVGGLVVSGASVVLVDVSSLEEEEAL